MSTATSSAARLALAIPLLAILTGCALFSGDRRTAPPRDNRLQLSRACEQLAKNVDDPPIFNVQPFDPWQALAEYAVALGIANANIDATRECQRLQRERLAKGTKR